MTRFSTRLSSAVFRPIEVAGGVARVAVGAPFEMEMWCTGKACLTDFCDFLAALHKVATTLKLDKMFNPGFARWIGGAFDGCAQVGVRARDPRIVASDLAAAAQQGRQSEREGNELSDVELHGSYM